MKTVRRALLELWAILLLAAVVGFLGPFGTFLMGDFLYRALRWWLLLMAAYVVMRPIIVVCIMAARATRLPPSALEFWGLFLACFPLAMAWGASGAEEVRLLGGYSGQLTFTMLCALAIMTVEWWAERADLYLLHYYNDGQYNDGQYDNGKAVNRPAGPTISLPPAPSPPEQGSAAPAPRPRLYARLSPRFEGDILALESEDHYVRVHGQRYSELLLLRLRDAILEMDNCPGAQTHRSWWVAQGAVAEVVASGRSREIRLANGMQVPVARDSVDRLRQAGFLPIA